ncbi:hypothetical protein CYMTET_10329 [Cymbomonas tetramitiformis]|uniref:Polycystin cation channel PKD1/PKD2 domain-containing protein n=1 Tax=Cymbomonas tetramitiformis TaxID=36881 RepID=A0AAE0GPP5_9CHLO|nr:hypothetical protein CYMTET_10329 [Cymbomonas tetramitiformis]
MAPLRGLYEELRGGEGGCAWEKWQLIFVLFIIMAAVSESTELFMTKYRTGSFSEYFSSAWNYFDLCSISMSIVIIIVWITTYFNKMAPFDMHPRYDVYASLDSLGRYLKINDDDNGQSDEFDAVLDAFTNMRHLTSFQVTYMMLHGLNSFLLIARMLKVCDFQPRMGILTRTLTVAASDLYHFFILLFLIFVGYGVTGHLVFGTTLEAFSEPFKSMYTLFNLMVFGDNSVAEDMFLLSESQGIAMGIVSMVFYMSYAVLVVLVLVNFLLAIIVDAFTVVKESIKESTSLNEEVWYYGKAIFNQNIRRSELHDDKILAMLKNLEVSEREHLKAQGTHPSIWEPCEDPAAAAAAANSKPAWKDKILITERRQKNVATRGSEVAQTLEDAAMHMDDVIEEKRHEQEMMPTPPEESCLCSSHITKRIMDKFGRDPSHNDAEDEKEAKRQQQQEILDILKLIQHKQIK